MNEAVVKQLLYAMLERPIEVDQHVPAEDDVEFTERLVGDQVVLREDDILGERRIEERPVVFRRVVLRERPGAARLDVILRVLLHAIERKDPAARMAKNNLVDVGGVDARAIEQAFLLEENGHRVHLLARRTASV